MTMKACSPVNMVDWKGRDVPDSAVTIGGECYPVNYQMSVPLVLHYNTSGTGAANGVTLQGMATVTPTEGSAQIWPDPYTSPWISFDPNSGFTVTTPALPGYIYTHTIQHRYYISVVFAYQPPAPGQRERRVINTFDPITTKVYAVFADPNAVFAPYHANDVLTAATNRSGRTPTMFHVKYCTLIALVFLFGYSERVCQAQLLHDAYALAETRADLPDDWEAYPENIVSTRRNSAKQSAHTWMGRRENPMEPPSPHNIIFVSSSVRVVVCKSQQEARANLRIWTTGNVVDPIPGAYSSKNLGDICFRGTGHLTSASLWFCRANLACDVHVNGPAGELNYPVVVEKIARAILDRAEASLALEATGEIPVLPSGQNVGIRNPRGVPVVLVDEWAAGSGATLTPDWNLGSVAVKQGKHILRLNVGSQDAQLDGNPLTLPFPALRRGKDRLWCPTEILNKLSE